MLFANQAITSHDLLPVVLVVLVALLAFITVLILLLKS
jgi:hypothetical protein